jgi:mono/diheme cytochrome c family protein
MESSQYMPEQNTLNPKPYRLSSVSYLLSACILVIFLSACNANPTSVVGYEAIPTEGDVARGEVLFTSGKELAPPCSGCHIPNAPASPDLAGFGEVAATRVEGESAHEYAFYSITEPGRFIVEGYGNAMYNMYDEALTPQDLADLIAYILSL